MTYITEQVARRLNMLSTECKKWANAPHEIPSDKREELSMMFGSTFTDFRAFAELGMKYLGFDLSNMQADIAQFMQKGRAKRMVQAQRGQAKSTLAALYCIWLLLRDPTCRVLIVSGGEKQASDVALMIIRMIMNWSLLCWLRPDIAKGDRSSVSAFDVHHYLKGIDKSASVSCVGITANLQGMRADFILADDIETQRNSMTQTEREKLQLLIKEFAAICISGEIMYLGTPQTKDSIYRLLPARGYDVRVWTGRYPTNEELERYGAGVTIAPMIMQALLENPALQTGGGIEGNRGQPTDDGHINEDILQEKELEYGEEGFSLQYMLDTTLSDALRTKIKLSDTLVLAVDNHSVPERLHWQAEPSKLYKGSSPNVQDFRMYHASGVSDTFVPFEHKVMTLDPAGAGGDELSFAAGGATNSYIYLLSVGGFLGGTTQKNIEAVIEKMLLLDIHVLDIEKNMGHGTVLSLFVERLEALKNLCKQQSKDIQWLCTSTGLSLRELESKLNQIGLTEYYVTGQKERRIIDTISPLTRRHKLVVTVQAIEDDWEYCKGHNPEKRLQFSAFQQMGNITYDRNSLVHDDRADCVQRVVEVLAPFLSKDEEKAHQERQEAVTAEFLKNPMGYSPNVLAQLNHRGAKRNNYKRRGSIRR